MRLLPIPVLLIQIDRSFTAIDPLFWLGLSLLLVAVSLTAVLVAAVPAFHELARASRSAEKLFDTLKRDLPPTLEAIRLTGLEISDLTDDVSDGVKSAAQVAKQVDRSLDRAREQARSVEINTRSVLTGVKAAWKNFTRTTPDRRNLDRLSAESRQPLPLNFDRNFDNSSLDNNTVIPAENRLKSPPSYPSYFDDEEE
jgi:hypothetical protein